MKNWLPLLILPLVVVIAFGWWQQRRSPSHAIVNAQPVTAATHSNEPITPLPESSDLDAAKVALGEQLFHDPILSHNNKVSCSSCHSLTTAGVDQLVHSVGIDGQRGSVNAPTVFNSGLNFVQFWDGRAATLEEQVDGPMSSPMEMGSNWDEYCQSCTLRQHTSVVLTPFTRMEFNARMFAMQSPPLSVH